MSRNGQGRRGKLLPALLPVCIMPAVLTVQKDSYAGHAKSPWLVVVPRRLSPTGKRQYRRFSTRAQAQSFCASVKMRVRQAGEQPLVAMPAPLAADAESALQLLEGSGLSLTEAVRQLLELSGAEGAERAVFHSSGGAGEQEPPGGEFAPAFGATAPITLSAILATIEGAKGHQAEATKRTRRGVCVTLFRRNPGLSETPLEACTTVLIQRALDRAWPASAQTWNTGRRILHAMFSYAIKRRLVRMENPVTPIDLKHVREAEIIALPPAALRALFDACRPASQEERLAAEMQEGRERYALLADTTCLRGYVAICAFAGIRPAECSRLKWCDINEEEGIVSVRAAASKTGGVRHIELHPALRAWLAVIRPAGARDGDYITPQNGLTRRLNALRRRAGYGEEKAWQNDCLRHSYATYFLKAKVGDIRQLQYNMGHRSSALLYARYTNMRGVTQAAAESWWQVLPRGGEGGAGEAKN